MAEKQNIKITEIPDRRTAGIRDRRTDERLRRENTEFPGSGKANGSQRRTASREPANGAEPWMRRETTEVPDWDDAEYEDDLRRKRREKARYEQRRREYIKQKRRKRRLRRVFRGALLLTAAIAVLAAAGFLVSRSIRPSQAKIDSAEIQARIPDWITQDFLTPNPYSRPQTALEQVNGVVVHYVGNPGTSASANRNYFNSLAETKTTSASSHFVIGLDGEIIQCIPLNEISYCSNHRNKDTVAIECCHPDADGQFTQETYDSLVRLVRWLCDEFKLDSSEAVIRHYDVTGKECPRYYVRNPEAWEQFLKDVKNAE